MGYTEEDLARVATTTLSPAE
jgi:hypothetical protein